jgi:hypothetical protein
MRRLMTVLGMLAFLAWAAAGAGAAAPEEKYPTHTASPKVDNRFNKANPNYKEKTGASYEEKNLAAATDQVTEAAGLDAAQKALARQILRAYIYDWLDAFVCADGRLRADNRIPGDGDLRALAVMDDRFKAELPKAQYERYLAWRQGNAKVGDLWVSNSLRHLMPLIEPPAADDKEPILVYSFQRMNEVEEGYDRHGFGTGTEKRKVLDRFIEAKNPPEAAQPPPYREPHITVELMPSVHARGCQRPREVALVGAGLEAFVNGTGRNDKRAYERIDRDLAELARKLGQENPIIISPAQPNPLGTDSAEPWQSMSWARRPGTVPALGFSAKDFQDLGPADDAAPKNAGSAQDGFFCSVKWGAKAPLRRDDVRLTIAVNRCLSTEAAQLRAWTQLELSREKDPPPLKYETEGPLAEVGDGCFLISRSDGAADVAFSRCDVQVLLHASDGAGDRKLLETAAQRIDKALLGWLVEIGKLPRPVAVAGQVPALGFAAKNFADLGDVKVSDKNSERGFYAVITRPGEKSPPLAISIERHESDAAQKAFRTAAGPDDLTSDLNLPGDKKDRDAGLQWRAPPTAVMPTWSDIGDARVVTLQRTAQDGVVSPIAKVTFLRNNVVVRLIVGEGPAAGRGDLEAIARRIDKQLVKAVVAPKDAPPAAKADK